ncbi:hypothetical protein EDB47_1421, partial [Vibrio crassostreae]
MYKYKLVTIPLLIAGLTGCGEGSSSKAEPEVAGSLKAYNGLA